MGRQQQQGGVDQKELMRYVSGLILFMFYTLFSNRSRNTIPASTAVLQCSNSFGHFVFKIIWNEPIFIVSYDNLEY